MVGYERDFFGTLNFLLFILDTPQTPWLQVETLLLYDEIIVPGYPPYPKKSWFTPEFAGTFTIFVDTWDDVYMILHDTPKKTKKRYWDILGMVCSCESSLKTSMCDKGYGIFFGSPWFTVVQNPLVLAHHPWAVRRVQRDSQELVGCDHPQDFW